MTLRELSTRMIEAVLDGEGLHGVAELAAAEAGGPVAIVLPSRGLAASAPGGGELNGLAEYAKAREKRGYRYEAGILFDLCHAKGAKLKLEANSVRLAPQLVAQVWKVAEGVGAKSFVPEQGFLRDGGDGVLDNHLALNRAGIPTIDVIDFDYRYWHTLADTPDKISPEQVAEVAKVMTTWLQGIR